MDQLRYGQFVHVVPVLAPTATAQGTTVHTTVVGAKEYSWIRFLVLFGNVDVDATVTVQECSDTVPTNTNTVTAKYRLSAAVGTDAMGNIADLPTSGVVVTAASGDNRVLCVDYNPAGRSPGYPYVRLRIANAAGTGSNYVGAVALATPRYPQDAQLSAVD